jgi:CheY-like chemotaxis protein
MAEMNGMEAYDAIQRVRPGLERRMVFMTGGAFTSRAQQFLDSVPNPILEKPFQPGDLLRVLEEIGGSGPERPS